MTHRLLDRRAALEAVAERVGGTLVEGKRVMGGYAVVVEHGAWTLSLDLHMAWAGMVQLVHTRVVSHFANRDRFRLVVRRRTLLDRIAAAVGLGGATSGDRPGGRWTRSKGAAWCPRRQAVNSASASLIARLSAFQAS